MRKWETLLAAVVGSCIMAGSAFAGEWKADQNGWWYQKEDGSYHSGGWQWIDGRCYYFDGAGYCLTGTTTPDGYVVDGSGAWVIDGVVQTQQAAVSGDDRLRYKGILDLYHAALTQRWDTLRLLDAGLNYMCHYYNGATEIGYTFMDLDGDGINELLIGEMPVREGLGDMLFDVYTVSGGQVTLVASSEERDRYYLCQGKELANEGSASAFISSYSYYVLSGGRLRLEEAVIYDETIDKYAPWFYSTVGWGDEGSYIPISERTAETVMDQHPYQMLSLTPFSMYR